MSFWITVHWPPRRAWKPGFVDPTIYIKDGRQSAGEDLRSGDLVFVYETKTGKPYEEEAPLQVGRQGIVALCRVTKLLHEVRDLHNTWTWVADMEMLSDEGNVVPREEVNQIIGFGPGNYFKGAGKKCSGLIEITEEQFQSILDLYLPGTRWSSL